MNMQNVSVSEEALQAAVKKAIELEILPQYSFADIISENYKKIENLLTAVFNVEKKEAPNVALSKAVELQLIPSSCFVDTLMEKYKKIETIINYAISIQNKGN